MATKKRDAMTDVSTFCFYCQRQLKTRRGFVKHVLTKHPDTYASAALKAERI